MSGTGARRLRRLIALLLVALLAATCGSVLPDPTRPGWVSPGLIGGGGWPYAGRPLAAADSHGASYLPDSSVVLLRDGRVRLVRFGTDEVLTLPRTDPRVTEAVQDEAGWLARGRIPGDGSAFRDMSARALLDLRLLTRPSGASVASWYGAWRYAWPRDSSFAAAAFAVSGHRAEARRVLRFLARVQNADGLWAARYEADGTAVTDGRAAQLDSLGWVLWATWFVGWHDRDRPAEMWPMVRRAADRLSDLLGADGLPPASSDYFERDPGTEQAPGRPTLGVAGPVLAGLRAATALAEETRHPRQAHRWGQAADRLESALDRHFAPYGYPRSPVAGGRMDTSVTFIAPPFGPADTQVTAAVLNAAYRLRLPNGGVLPGEKWAGDKTTAWTPEMALFALSAAAGERPGEAAVRLDWLSRHRTTLGALPEKVDAEGRPAAVAPLGWTASLVVLTLAALERPLPVPPA